MSIRIEDALGAQAEWTVVSTQGANATATATKAAVTGQRHYITGISISASAAPAAAVSCTLTDAGANIDQFEIPAAAFAPVVPSYTRALRCTIGGAVVLTLPALGAGVTGRVVIKGFTR